MDSRKVVLNVHLYLGLVSALFLVILGLTGSIMAFEGDFDHWVHRDLWHVSAGSQPLPEAQLIQAVDQQFAPAHVRGVNISPDTSLAQVMTLPKPGGDPSGDPRLAAIRVSINPYNGAILGVLPSHSKLQETLSFIHSLHLRLATGPIGKTIINFAGLILLIEVPLGLILWWRTKRTSVAWNASAHRLSFDLHLAVGIYAAIFLFVSALTGVIIGFDFTEPMIFNMTHSAPLVQRRPPDSTVVPGGTSIGVDKAMEIARTAMPTATVAGVQLPGKPTSSYIVAMRVPEEVTETVHSTVVVDQYSGQVLRTQNFATDSRGYRVIRWNRSLHTGDIYGMPTHILMSLSSLVLVLMVVTGVIIWWKKLAI